MQFDGNELEKDDNNKPLEDDDNGAISWEDLLNTDDEDDLSSLIVNSAKDNDADEKSDISNFDISSLSDDELVLEKNEEFDLKTAATNYVNSLEQEDAAIETKGADDNKQTETTGSFEDDDILNMLADDADVQNEADSETVSKEDLSDVVDDELLSLLDVKNDSPSSFASEAIDDVLNFEKEEKAEETTLEQKENIQEQTEDAKEPEVLTNEEDLAAISENTEEENKNAEVDDQLEIKPLALKKDNKKLIMAVVIGLAGLFAVIVIALYFLFPGLTGNTNGDNLMTSEDSNYAIPNDSNAASLDDEKQTEELMNKLETKKDNVSKKDSKDKKIVVAIQPSGRTNPFMPSSLFNEDGSLAMGGDLSTPPDVDVNSPEAAAGRKLFSIMVSGIMYDSERPSAILKYDGNDYFVQKGDKIDTYTVSQITKEFVQIKNGANIYKAYVGEIFNIGDIPKSKQIQYDGRTRQYISAEDIQISTK